MSEPLEQQLRSLYRHADRLQTPVAIDGVGRAPFGQRPPTEPGADPSELDSTATSTIHHRADGHDEITDWDIIMLEATDYEASTSKNGSKNRWLLVAAVIAALALVGGLILAATGSDDDPVPADQPEPTPTGDPAPTNAMSDLEVIEAGVNAFYSGDAERASELFELADRTDDQIRAESAYQAAVGGWLGLTCNETAPGSFNCTTPYRNAMTDAIGEGGGHDVWPVTVEDGVITQFGFTEHSGMLLDMGTFLASEGRFDGFENCLFGPFVESCATIQMENLEAWATWHDTAQPADRVEAVVESWYRGDCEAAVRLSWGDVDCSAASLPAQTIEYESILGAQVSVENCEKTAAGEHLRLSCEVHYSNVMNDAVGTPPSVTDRAFLLMFGVLPAGADEQPWYEVDYPEDTELRDSFKTFADAGNLAAEYADEGCATARSPECAHLIVDNLDAWATWYQTNG